MSDSDFVVLWTVVLAGKHTPTGRTTHYGGGCVLPPPHSLQIAQYPNDDGCYLFYLDEYSNELTDTYHSNLAKAFDQAEWEFGVKQAEWEKVT